MKIRDVPRALTAFELVLHVKDGVAAADALLALAVLGLCVEKLLAEFRPLALRAGLLDHDLLPVVTDLVDDPFHRLAEFELVECGYAFGRDGHSRGMLGLHACGRSTRRRGVRKVR
jgi:hypothetical protein